MSQLTQIIAASRRRSTVFDADAADYFARIGTAGSSISDANKAAVDAFIRGCKTDGIWTAIKASCLLAGPDDLTGALVPLVGTAPTNVGGLFVAGDYSRTTGLKGDGSTKYLDSNRNNNVDPQNSKHLAIWQTGSEDRAATRSPIGTTASSAGASILSTNTTNRFGRIHINSGTGISNAGAYAGFWGVSRSASNASTLRFNSTNYTNTEASQAPANQTISVFRRDATTWSPARLSFYSIGEHLDLALLDARLITYMATLS
jgi:hypothetical protein